MKALSWNTFHTVSFSLWSPASAIVIFSYLFLFLFVFPSRILMFLPVTAEIKDMFPYHNIAYEWNCHILLDMEILNIHAMIFRPIHADRKCMQVY